MSKVPQGSSANKRKAAEGGAANAKKPRVPSVINDPEYLKRKDSFFSLTEQFNGLDARGRLAFAKWISANQKTFWSLKDVAADDAVACGLSRHAGHRKPPSEAQLKVFGNSKLISRVVGFVVGDRLDCMCTLFHASNVALVCKTFRTGVDTHFREKVTCIDLRADLSLGASLKDCQLTALLRRTPVLRELRLRYCSRLTSPGLDRILRSGFCPHLRVLQLGAISTKKSLDHQCSHRFSENVALAIAECLPELEELNISLMNCCDDRALQTLTLRCPNMKTLFIGAQGSNVTDDGFQHLSVENGSNTFVSRWPNMNALSVFGLRFLSDDGVNNIAHSLSTLRYLDLEACHKVTNESLRVIARECKHLEHLLVGGLNIGDDAIINLAVERKDTLKTLDISECTNLTDRAVTAVAQNCGENLQSIDLSFVHQLTDVAIRSLAEHCPNLRQIVILDCAFGSSATNDLIKRCGHVLEDITLGSCADESTAAESSRNDNTRLMTIANHCPALVRLDVSGDVRSGTDGTGIAHGLRTISRRCSKLRSLTLNSCDLADSDMQYILSETASRCLRSLMLNACNNLTPAAFNRVASSTVPRVGGGPELAYVKIVDCKNLSGEDEVDTLVALLKRSVRKKLWVSFCGEGETSKVASYIKENRCQKYWIKTEKHVSAPGQYVVNVEALPRKSLAARPV